jgi:hypothetical protein
MSNNYGIRYVVVAVGDLNDKAEEEDIEAMKWYLERGLDSMPTVPKFTILSERVSDKLTVSLLQEMGALP